MSYRQLSVQVVLYNV